jgi:hypothetical protein
VRNRKYPRPQQGPQNILLINEKRRNKEDFTHRTQNCPLMRKIHQSYQNHSTSPQRFRKNFLPRTTSQSNQYIVNQNLPKTISKNH